MEALFAHCLAAFSQSGGMFAVFFLGGLMGSLTHCLIMCGPVVACQSACGGSCGMRMSAASQWQYHLGRLATYGALGFFAALLSKHLAAASYWPMVSMAMMVLAAGLFLLSAIIPNQHPLLSYAPKNGFLRGALMSFMPCGLIYAALMMAATLAHPLLGMVAMWLFVLGTIPALLVASGGAAILALKWQDMMRGIGRFGLAFNGLALLAMAAKTMR
jgi:sulfite exporter TauE/SafE